MDEITELVQATAATLCRRRITMATAESCTGGWIAQQATALAGSSAWFEAGFVTYSDRAKQALLGVTSEALEQWGAVSATVAVAVSGIAGPDGGSEAKPVGTVWLAWGATHKQPVCQCRHFSGNREQVRWQTVVTAYEGLLRLLQEVE